MRIRRIKIVELFACRPGRTLRQSDVRQGIRILEARGRDRKSTRLNSSHSQISYAVFCLKKKKKNDRPAHAHSQFDHSLDDSRVDNAHSRRRGAYNLLLDGEEFEDEAMAVVAAALRAVQD